jgi:alcohol dehydrogenase class IV
MYDLPHADLHAALLPHSVALIEASEPGLVAPVAAALGGSSAAAALFDLAAGLGTPTSLAALGVTREQIQAAAPLVLAGAGPIPVALTLGDITAMLDSALAGQRPG